MISKTIYQTWSTQNLPEKLEKLHNKMKHKNSSFQHIIYTDEQMNDYINSNAEKEIRDVYWKMNHIVARADIWRYTILYNNGGVYLDMDSEIKGSLNKLIKDDDKAIITPETHENLFIQWGLIFENNHIILENTINNILEDVSNGLNKNDHHALTVKNYAKAIFNVVNKNNLKFKWVHPKEQKTETYHLNNSSFKVVGNDYNNHFSFKHKFNHLLRNRPKGTVENTH